MDYEESVVVPGIEMDLSEQQANQLKILVTNPLLDDGNSGINLYIRI